MSGVWFDVGEEESFKDELVTVSVGSEKVIVKRVDGAIHAFSARCPHKKALMENAEVEGSIMTCPLHGWQFDLENKGFEIHGYQDLPMHEVRVENNRVYIKE